MGALDTAVGIFGTVIPLGKSNNCLLARWELDGTLSWVHTQSPLSCNGSFPAVIDADGDGLAEVLIDGTLISAATGALIQQSSSTGLGYGYFTDLDGDGQREWLDGSAIRQSNGALICETGANEGIPTSADLDGDGDGEILINNEGVLSWYQHDCTLGNTWPHSTGLTQPLIADIDGDGAVEVVLQTESQLIAYEADGTQIWEQLLATASPMGATAMDVDGNEIADIVAVTDNELLLLDGKTGTARLSYVLDSTPKATPYALELNGGGAPESWSPLAQAFGSSNGTTVAKNKQLEPMAPTEPCGRHARRRMAVPTQSWQLFSPEQPSTAQEASLERSFAEIKPTLIETCTDDCDLGVVTFTVEIRILVHQTSLRA